MPHGIPQRLTRGAQLQGEETPLTRGAGMSAREGKRKGEEKKWAELSQAAQGLEEAQFDMEAR